MCRAPDQVALRSSGAPAFVAVLRVGAIRSIGLTVVLDDAETGHCSIPELNAVDRKSSRSKQWEAKLAFELCEDILGPFPPDKAVEWAAAGEP